MYPGCGVGGGATSRTFINRDVFGQNYNSVLKLENFIEIKQNKQVYLGTDCAVFSSTTLHYVTVNSTDRPSHTVGHYTVCTCGCRHYLLWCASPSAA